MKNRGNPWKLKKKHHWKMMKINGNRWQSIQINENMQNQLKCMNINEHQ